jgi:hypothetical protein
MQSDYGIDHVIEFRNECSQDISNQIGLNYEIHEPGHKAKVVHGSKSHCMAFYGLGCRDSRVR